MSLDDARTFDRRGFLRYTAVTGLAAVTAWLTTRRTGQTCISRGICRGCAAYDNCKLPQALSAKTALGDKTLR